MHTCVGRHSWRNASGNGCMQHTGPNLSSAATAASYASRQHECRTGWACKPMQAMITCCAGAGKATAWPPVPQLSSISQALLQRAHLRAKRPKNRPPHSALSAPPPPPPRVPLWGHPGAAHDRRCFSWPSIASKELVRTLRSPLAGHPVRRASRVQSCGRFDENPVRRCAG